YKPLKGLADLHTNLQEGLAAANRVFMLLDTKPKIIDSNNAVNIDIISGEIKFENAKFSYPNGKEAIDDISIYIPANKTIAFVGASGGGKSTIVNLILRFYDILKGKISIDGINIKDISLQSLRSNIALVTQETALFDDTILANIAYAKDNATIEDVENAAKKAYAHNFISELPEGYNTIVGQHGLKLSGGQRQRIALARAILKNAKIFILDEATSALDNNSEKLIQESLSKLKHNKTIIIIAHRLSTIIDADLIYVIDEGKIIEQGTHCELLNHKGEYSKLYSKEQIV
ncbi:MAG: ABC transporter ATP-binding protein, partial [Alphaproteobacteria bacterium]